MAHGEHKLTQEQISRAEQVLPMWKIILSQFLEHRAAVVGVVVIFIYLMIAIFAPVISMITDLDPEEQNPLARYQKPFSTTTATKSQIDETAFKLTQTNPDQAKSLKEDILANHLVILPSDPPPETDVVIQSFLSKDFTEVTESLKQLKLENQNIMKPMMGSLHTFHLLGTDELGRDVLIRLIYGTRVSMGVGMMVTLAAAIIGLLIGSLSGFYGGFIDTALMRLTDALLSLPTIPIMILFAAVDLDKIPAARAIITPQNESIMKLVVILILFSWMRVARLVRGSVLSLKEREFILAAHTMGAKDSTIILRHLFPNVIAPLLVAVTLGVGDAILSEAALSFLGLGIHPPTPSWGNMLFNAQELISEAPFLAFLPGLNILAVVMSFNYLGDGLQDAVDPKAIRR